VSEYLGNRDVLFDPSNGTQPRNDLQDYHEHLPILAHLTSAPDRFQGAIWPSNNPVGTEYVQGAGNPSGPFVEAPQGGWNAERIMSQPGADVAANFVLGVGGGPFRRVPNPLTVYHGTPHTFPPTEGNPLGEFDLSKVGSGEGFQAYGHGVYQAGAEDVARGYKDRLSGAAIIPGAPSHVPGYAVDGVYPPTGMAGHAAMDTAIDLNGLLSAMHAYENKPSHSSYWKKGDPIAPDWDMRPSYQQSIDYLRQTIERRIDAFRERLGGEKPSGIADRDMADLADYYDAHVRNAKPEDVMQRPPGRMYESEFHAELHELLDWDKPLSEQSPQVREALAKLGVTQPEKWEYEWTTGPNGRHVLYRSDYPDMPLATLEPVEKNAPDDWFHVHQGNGYGAYGGAGRLESAKQMAEDKYGSRLSPETRMMTGEQLLDALKANLRHEDNPRVAAAEALRDAGVKGIRYLDADSRRRGAGTYNYVVFDPTALNIVRRYGIGALLGGGAAAAAGEEQ